MCVENTVVSICTHDTVHAGIDECIRILLYHMYIHIHVCKLLHVSSELTVSLGAPIVVDSSEQSCTDY